MGRRRHARTRAWFPEQGGREAVLPICAASRGPGPGQGRRGGGELASVDRARDTRPGPSACLCSTCGHHGRIPNPTKDFSFRLSYLKVLSYQIITTTTTTLMKRNMVTSMPGQGREGTSLATGLGSGFNVRCRPVSVTCAVSHVHLFTPYCIAFYN